MGKIYPEYQRYNKIIKLKEKLIQQSILYNFI